MRRTGVIVCVAATVVLAGCATGDVVWNHPTKEQSQFYTDEAECQRQRQQVAMQVQQMQRAQQQQSQAQAQSPSGRYGAAMGTLIGKGLKAAFGGPSPSEEAYENCMKSKGYRVEEGA
jgi:invasion protein IalB